MDVTGPSSGVQCRKWRPVILGCEEPVQAMQCMNYAFTNVNITCYTPLVALFPLRLLDRLTVARDGYLKEGI